MNSTIVLATLLSAVTMFAQGTEGLVSGRITDAITGRPLDHAVVVCTSLGATLSRTTRSNPEGIYAIPLLPPGTYQLRVESAGFQSKEQAAIPLGVSASLDLNFALRPLDDIWESRLHGQAILPKNGMVLSFYGPDVDPNHWTTYAPNAGAASKLEASLSDAVRPEEIRQLPLDGDDIYSILLAEPGVTANSAVSRSLGLAANGQRTSSSNFLLDGVELNFSLVSGPLVSVAPDAIQEYRLTTNNFSAEYGRAAGYLANAVSRSGGDAWHGVSFFKFQNDVFNAADFQDNIVQGKLPANGRRPDKEYRPGGFLGGPVWKDRLFLGTSLEFFRSRSAEEPQTYNLPSAAYVSSRCGGPTMSFICPLLRDYPIAASNTNDQSVTEVRLAEPITLHQWLGMGRIDYSSAGGAQHAYVRVAVSNLSRPDFIWTPYQDYISGLDQPAVNASASLVSTLSPRMMNRLTGGWTSERLSWERAHPEMPTFLAAASNIPGVVPILPGSPAAYGLNNGNRDAEIHDNAIIVRGNHIVKAGGDLFWRSMDDFLGYGLDGKYTFPSLPFFGSTSPFATTFTTAITRQGPFGQPDLSRSYRSLQYALFAQDTWRVTPRLVFNVGIRYDSVGAPSSTGPAKDWVVQFGTGTSFDQRVHNAMLVPPSGSRPDVYGSDNHNFAPRFGFAYDLANHGRLLLRGGFGIFYDRIFDNLWLNARNNSFVVPTGFNVTQANYLNSIPTVLPAYAGQTYAKTFPFLTAFQPNLHDGYAEDFFTGLQWTPSSSVVFELNGAGSLGRRLLTTDVINRNQPNSILGDQVDYLGSQGFSNYYSLDAIVKWRFRRGFLQAAYTWSHAIDNQSDPIAGDFFDLLFVNTGPPTTSLERAAFMHQYDSRGDRGNADFDQRHSLVFYSSWKLPKGFTISQIAAIRSGFPYTIYSAIAATDLNAIAARAIPAAPGSPLFASPTPVTGGEQIFDQAAFCTKGPCGPASGRNAFAGPGSINLDVAISRESALRWLGESGALILRADFFNFLNHANLNPPDTSPGDTNYGIALYGRPQASSGFPSLIPLNQSSRRIQLEIRLRF